LSALGLLDRDTGADNGFLQTVRTEDADGYTVSATTAEGRLSTFRVEEDAAGSTIRTSPEKAVPKSPRPPSKRGRKWGQLWGHLEKRELILSLSINSL
jgi:hypothetical protein